MKNRDRMFRRSDPFRDLGQRAASAEDMLQIQREYDRSTPWFNVGTTGAPAYLSPWTPFGSGFVGARYMRDASGVVHIQGMVQATVNGNGTPIFQLPESFRPGQYLIFGNLRVEGGVYQVAHIQIGPDGWVHEFNTVTNDSGITQWCTLAGILFPAEA